MPRGYNYHNLQRRPIPCPNKRCRRPLTWKPARRGWAPTEGAGCVICKTPQAFALAHAAHKTGKTWLEIRREYGEIGLLSV